MSFLRKYSFFGFLNTALNDIKIFQCFHSVVYFFGEVAVIYFIVNADIIGAESLFKLFVKFGVGRYAADHNVFVIVIVAFNDRREGVDILPGTGKIIFPEEDDRQTVPVFFGGFKCHFCTRKNFHLFTAFAASEDIDIFIAFFLFCDRTGKLSCDMIDSDFSQRSIFLVAEYDRTIRDGLESDIHLFIAGGRHDKTLCGEYRFHTDPGKHRFKRFAVYLKVGYGDIKRLPEDSRIVLKLDIQLTEKVIVYDRMQFVGKHSVMTVFIGIQNNAAEVFVNG